MKLKFTGCRLAFAWRVLLAALCLFALAGCLANKQKLEAARAENMQKDKQALQAPKADAAARLASKDNPPAPAPLPAALSGKMSLDDCIRKALAQNPETLIAAQEKLLQDQEFITATLRLLPQLMVEAERSWKNQDVPSSSKSAITGQMSLEPSISSDKNTVTQSMSLSWDLLNLAVNAFRVRQVSGKTMIASEKLRRAKQNAELEVTQAYMKAAVAKDIAAKADELIAKAKQRQNILAQQMAKGTTSKAEGLQNEIDVVEMQIRFKSYADEFKQAKAKLAEAMGVGSPDSFDIADYDFFTSYKAVDVDLKKFEDEALRQRPELFERDVEEQISLDEAKIAMTRMFPTLTPFFKYSYDANSYLSKHDWTVTGLKLTWDMLSVPRFVSDRAAAEKQAELERKRRVKTSMAVLTQVRLASIEYHDAVGKLPLTADLEVKRKQLMLAVERQVELGKLRESLLIDEDQKYLLARLKHLSTWAEFVVAKAKLNNSLGRDYAQGPALP